MKRTVRLLVLALLALAATICLAGCGEKGDFTGVMTDAYQGTITVQAGSEVKTFETTDQTVYALAQEDHLNIGDTILVSYHTKGSKTIADSITVRKVKKNITKMEGQVSDLNDKNVTITSDSLTAIFTMDDNTAVEGKLSEGDVVEITYTGDLNEKPYARNIRVLKEKSEEKTYEAHGIVADVTDTSLLLSEDSATSHWFEFTDTTKIDSSDNKIEVGDRAEITFSGDIDHDPIAREVVVHHQAKKDEYVINGKIKKAGGTEFQLNTGENTYTFLINGNTKFTGGKYQSGVKATVTYTGKLGKDPLAVAVYCDKKKKEDPTKKTTRKTEPTTTEPTSTEPTTTEEPTSSDPPVPPEPVIVEAQGVLTQWDGDALTCEVQIDDDTVVDLTTDEATIAAGYFPQVGDTVLIKYEKESLSLIDMQLVDRPDPDEPDEPEEPTQAPTKEEPTEPPTTTEAPTTTTAAPTTTTEAPTTEAEPSDDGDNDSDDGGDDR